MHGYFNDIHFLNIDHIPNCLFRQRSFTHVNQASIELLQAGKLFYIVNGHEYVLKAPVVFWNVPGKTYEYRTIANSPRNHYWVDFTGPRAKRIGKALDRLTTRNFIIVSNPGDFSAIFDDMINIYCSGDPTGFFKLAVSLEKLIGLIYETVRNKKIVYGKNAILHQLAREIADNPFLDWNFMLQARKNSLSYSHFRRLFRTVTDMPPHDYLLFCRARKAAYELKTRNISIKQLAFEHGFSDPSALSRLIKNKLGTAPSALITRQRSNM